MTLEIDHNEIHNEIDPTPSIDRDICTHANESSKSSDNTNQQNLQTEDENINEVTPLLNNTVYTPMISNEKNVSRKEDKQIKRVKAELAAVKSHLKCKIANMNSKIESMSNSFASSLNKFNDQLNNFSFPKENLNHNNSNLSSSTSRVNNNTT